MTRSIAHPVSPAPPRPRPAPSFRALVTSSLRIVLRQTLTRWHFFASPPIEPRRPALEPREPGAFGIGDSARFRVQLAALFWGAHAACRSAEMRPLPCILPRHAVVLLFLLLALCFQHPANAAPAKPKNIAPVLSLPSGAVNYDEGAPPLVIDPSAGIYDPDSPDFNTGQLKVELSRNGQDNDLLSVQSGGSLSLSGSKVYWDGASIATVSGGKGKTALVFKFTAAATPSIAQALLASITYTCQSKAPSTLIRTVRFTLSDGDGGNSPAVETQIYVTPYNDPPSITVAAAQLHYKENGAPIPLDAAANFYDDASSFAGGQLTIEFPENAASEDRLSIVANSSKRISVSGTSIYYAGQAIAWSAGGTELQPLVISFIGPASVDAVKATLNTISFSNPSDAPSTVVRTFRVVALDPGGLESPAVTRSLDVIAVNDPPTLTFSTQSLTYNENDPPLTLDAEATLADLDSFDFDGGKLTVTVKANGQTEDRLMVVEQNSIAVQGSSITYNGVAVGSLSGGASKSPLIVTFNRQSDLPAVEAVLRSLAYTNSSDNPVTKPRTLSLNFTDGDGGTSATFSKNIQVNAVLDPPLIVLPTDPISSSTPRAVIAFASSARVSDPDTANFANGALMIDFASGAESTDRIYFESGTRTGQINVSGETLSLNKTAFGTFSGGSGFQSLSVSLNIKATPAILQTLLGSLRFIADSDQPSSSTRVFRFTLSDGTGELSVPVDREIRLSFAPPVVTVPPPTATPPPITNPPVVVIPPPVVTQPPQNAPDDDPDGDGLSNAEELALGTNPNNPDSDGNGIPDGWEDKDGDTWVVLDELRNNTSPNQFNPPQPPDLTSVTLTGNSVRLEWDVLLGSPSEIRILRDQAVIATLSSSTRSYVDSDPPFSSTPEGQLLYQIQAVYPQGLSMPSQLRPIVFGLSINTFPPPNPQYPIQLWLDLNHDGTMEATDTSPTTDTREHPFRFWVNDDSDFTFNPNDGESTEKRDQLTDANYGPVKGRPSISSMRDLEDHARLWISGVPALSASDDTWKVRLAWESSGPTLRIHYATDRAPSGQRDGGDRYVRDLSAAQAQVYFDPNHSVWSLPNPGLALGYVTASSPLDLPNSLFSGQPQFFLFTAISEGSGILTVSLLHNGQTVVASRAAIQIRRVGSLFESPLITGVSDDPAAQNATSFRIASRPPSQREDSNEIIVFVHGWRVTQFDYENFTATLYKRLWWQGFQGRLASVHWETLSGDDAWIPPTIVYSGRTFNMSEFRAYRSGRGVAEYLKALRARYPNHNIGLIAHSMGNTVMAETLRLLAAEGQKPIDNYVLLQAAFPAQSYDPQAPAEAVLTTTLASRPTPNSYLGYASGIAQGVRGNIVNFINPNDFALQTGRLASGMEVNWIANQRDVKPDNETAQIAIAGLRKSTTPRNYYADATSGWITYLTYANPPPFGSIPLPVTQRDLVTNPHELMAFVARSRSRAAGALAGVGGPINNAREVNLNTRLEDGGVIGLAAERNEHSGQFNWNLQRTVGLYRQLLDSLGLGRTQR